MDFLAQAVVWLAGVFLVGLGVLSLAARVLARRFLLGFASSPMLHYLEVCLRLCIGAAFVQHAPAMRFPVFFTALGWLLVLTTAGLMLVPWRWHRRFAQFAVPRALRYLGLMGSVSLLFGAFVLFGLFGTA